MHQHPLTVEIRPDGRSVTLALAGEIDLASCPTLRVCLEQLAPTFDEVVVDLADVAFIDSTGLSTLVATQRSLLERGGALVVRNASGHVHKVMEVSGVDQLLTVLP